MSNSEIVKKLATILVAIDEGEDIEYVYEMLVALLMKIRNEA